LDACEFSWEHICEERGKQGGGSKKKRKSERLTPPGKEDLFVIRLYFSFVLFPFFALPSSTFFFAVNTHCLSLFYPLNVALIIN
jgi:hypothetical protein